jgi:signal recognition particle subunit SRP54
MFERLTDRLQSIFQGLGGKGRLTERDVDTAMREVRTALLEADVNLKVVRELVTAIRERAIGQEVLTSLTPAQTVIKIVHEELIKILGEGAVPLNKAPNPPTLIMLVGLNGAGKTSTAAKLALHLKKQGMHPLLVAADVYRPAAITQLQTLGGQVGVPVYSEGTNVKPADIVQHAIAESRINRNNPLIIDTAGRLQINEEMMRELEGLRSRFQPHETLLVADAMTGQEAVAVAEEFNRRVSLTGLVLTKMDGDARGGAALSIRSVTQVPIKFITTDEKVTGLEVFHPDRVATRILGMGDMLSLIERAQQDIDQTKAEEMQRKLLEAEFTLEDFLEQLQRIRNMGPLQQILEMIPGLGAELRRAQAQVDDKDLVRIQAMIQSMTVQERQQPSIIKGRRITRIARGSGMQEKDVLDLLQQFRQMQQMMKQMGTMAKGGGKRGLPGLGALGKLGQMGDLESLLGGGGLGGGLPPRPSGPTKREPSGLPTAPPPINLSQARHQAKKREKAARPAQGGGKRKH